MSERKSIPKAVRFEVFKRDSFTCQYCGRKAPEVVLECDHIHPVADGGQNHVLNLITACGDCNRGKGARKLSETHILEKQRVQMDELNERRVQLEMLAEWHRELSSLDTHRVDVLEEFWSDLTDDAMSLTPYGRDQIRAWTKRFTDAEIFEAMKASCSSYLERDEFGRATYESASKAFDYVPRVARVRQADIDKPHMKRLFYIRGILRNRLRYVREDRCLDLMEEAVAHDIDLDWLERFAKRVSSWTAFCRSLEDFVAEQQP